MVDPDVQVSAMLWFDRESQDRAPVAEVLARLLERFGACDVGAMSPDPGPTRLAQERSIESFLAGGDGAHLLLAGGVSVLSGNWNEERTFDRGASVEVSHLFGGGAAVAQEAFGVMCRATLPRQGALRVDEPIAPEYIYVYGPQIMQRRMDLSVLDRYLAWDDGDDYWLGPELARLVGLSDACLLSDIGWSRSVESAMLSPVLARDPAVIEQYVR